MSILLAMLVAAAAIAHTATVPRISASLAMKMTSTAPHEPLGARSMMRPFTSCTTGTTASPQCCPQGSAPSTWAGNCFYGPKWPYTQGQGKLNLTVWIDPTLPTVEFNGAVSGISSWNNSPTAIHFTTVSSAGSAQIQVQTWHDGTNCGGTYGFTQDQANGTISSAIVQLNADNSGCGNSTVWISTAAHELGHALGLDHNNWYPGTTYMLMNSCGSCTNSPTTPQSMDMNIINYFYPPTVTTPTTSARWTGVLSNGAVAVFKHDTSDSVSYRYQTTPGGTSWSAWTQIPNPSGDTIVGEPAVAPNSDGRLFVFARGASGKIWLLTQQTLGNPNNWVPWSNFTNPAGETMVSDPAVVQQANGALFMFVVGASGMVRLQNQTSAGGPWLSGYTQFSNPSGRTMTGNPAVVQGQDGRLYLFVIDNTGQVRLQNQTSPNGPWLSTGYTQFSNPSGRTMVGDPAVARQQDGSIYLFVRDNTGQIRVQNQTSPNGGWLSGGFSQFSNPSGRTMVGDPIAIAQANGSLFVFVRDDTNQIREQNQTSPNGGWLSTGYSQFSNPAGVTMPIDPAAALDGSGFLHLFSVGSDAQMYEAHQTAANGGWQALSAFGGTFPTI